MIDITFNVEGNKYKLTSDERNYILQQYKVIKSEQSKNVGQEKLTNPRFFGTVQNVFSYITRTYPMNCEEVISSLAELEEVQETVRASSEVVMAMVNAEVEEIECITKICLKE